MKRLRKQMETIVWSPLLKVSVDREEKLLFVEVAEPSSAADLISSLDKNPESFEVSVDLPIMVVHFDSVSWKEEWFERFVESLKDRVADWIIDTVGLRDPSVTIYKNPGIFPDSVSLEIRASGKIAWDQRDRFGGSELLHRLSHLKELIDKETYVDYIRNSIRNIVDESELHDKIDLTKVEVKPMVSGAGEPFGWEPPYEVIPTDVSPQVRHYYDTSLEYTRHVLDLGHLSDERFEEVIEALKRQYLLRDVISILMFLADDQDSDELVSALVELGEELGDRVLRKQQVDLESHLNNLREMIQNELESLDDKDEEDKRKKKELEELLEELKRIEEEYKRIVTESGTEVRPLRPVVREMLGGNLGGVGVPPSGPLPEHSGTVPTGAGVMWVKRLRKKLIKILRDALRKRLR